MIVVTMRAAPVASAAARSGPAAPTANEPAELTAACTGQRESGLADPEFVTQMNSQGVCLGQFDRDALRQLVGQPLGPVDRGELGQLAIGHVVELPALLGYVGMLGVTLRTNRNVFAERHRRCTRYETSHPRGQDRAPGRVRGRDAEDQTRGRDESVVRAQHHGSQQTHTMTRMTLPMRHHRPESR